MFGVQSDIKELIHIHRLHQTDCTRNNQSQLTGQTSATVVVVRTNDGLSRHRSMVH